MLYNSPSPIVPIIWRSIFQKCVLPHAATDKKHLSSHCILNPRGNNESLPAPMRGFVAGDDTDDFCFMHGAALLLRSCAPNLVKASTSSYYHFCPLAPIQSLATNGVVDPLSPYPEVMNKILRCFVDACITYSGFRYSGFFPFFMCMHLLKYWAA